MFSGSAVSMETESFRFHPPNYPRRLDPRETEGQVSNITRVLHAIGQPLAFEAFVREGRRELIVTVPHGSAPRILKALDGPYMHWSRELLWLAPPRAALRSRSVGVLSPAEGHQVGPFPTRLAHPYSSVWGGLLSLSWPNALNLWMRLVLTPIGRSLSRSLPWNATDEIRTPPHLVGRKVLDQRVERVLDQCWRVGGVALIWTEPSIREDSKGQVEVRRLVQRMVESLTSAPGGCGFTLHWIRTAWGRRRVIEHFLSSRLGRGSTPFRVPATLLSSTEVGLWFPSPYLSPVGLPPVVRGEPNVTLGLDTAGEPVCLPWSTREGHHLLAAGETGMGKSTLLVNLATSLSDPDLSVVVFDPRGDTVRSFVAHLAEDQVSHALLIAPTESPVAQNVLHFDFDPDAGKASIQRERLVSELVTAFRRVRAERFGDTFYWGPRIEDVLTRVFLLLSYQPGSTLLDAVRILENPGEALAIANDGEGDALAMRFLARGLSEEKPENLEGARRVIAEVTYSPVLSGLLASQGHCWDLSETLAPGRITLLSLERNAVSTRGSSFLGSILLSLLWSRILNRGKAQGHILLILDEVQDYANESLADMLRQGREYGVHIWAATQSIAALPEGLREALVTNAKDVILFRGSPSDARFARDELGLPPEDSPMTLARGEAFAFLGKSSYIRRFRMRTSSASLGQSALEGRYVRLVDQSRPFWAKQQPPHPAITSVGPSHPPSSETPFKDILLTLFAGATAMGAEHEFQVSVSLVRVLFQGNEELTRSFGRFLVHNGVLIRTLRSGKMRLWVLSTQGLGKFPGTSPSPEMLSEALNRYHRALSSLEAPHFEK